MSGGKRSTQAKVSSPTLGAAALAAAALAGPLAHAQEIGRVTIAPNATTGEMRADLPARPDGETVYVIRDGAKLATATVRESGGAGGALVKMSPADAAKVKVGDRISLSPTLSKTQMLPDSAYQPTDGDIARDPEAAKAERAAAKRVAADAKRLTTAPKPSPTPAAAPAAAPARRTSAAKPTAAAEVDVPGGGVAYARVAEPGFGPNTLAPPLPRMQPRGSEIPLYPAPAMGGQPEGNFLGPYGVGLAAAAPVGTPYLRSPAFAGPPLIYMPQTVTRVLLPGIQPYPANIMAPPQRYVYSSAPFTRTDIYVNLPYGTYYWPNGYAGTTPVEPQIPAYLTAPATAITTSEAAYTTQRYAPGAAQAETLNPITVSPGTSAPTEPVGAALPSVRTGDSVSISASGVGSPGAPAGDGGAPTSGVGARPGSPISTAGTAASALPALETLPPFPNSATPAPTPSAIPDLGATPGLGAIPPTATAPTGPSPNAEKPGIIVDDKTAGGLDLVPPTGFAASKSVTESYEGSSLIADIDGQVRTATFLADIPEDGEYEVLLWWTGSNQSFRSSAVPVTINTSSGPVKTTIDQTQNNLRFNSIGTYAFKSGPKQRVVTVSTEGLQPSGNTQKVSIDAMKLVKVR